eukprot:10344958-Prorocentrum_lima.AAC.1
MSGHFLPSWMTRGSDPPLGKLSQLSGNLTGPNTLVALLPPRVPEDAGSLALMPASPEYADR